MIRDSNRIDILHEGTRITRRNSLFIGREFDRNSVCAVYRE